MGCMLCCFRPRDDDEPSALVKKSGSPSLGQRKSYGAVSFDEDAPIDKKEEESSPRKTTTELLYDEPPKSARVKSPSPEKKKIESPFTVESSQETVHVAPVSEHKGDKKTLAEIADLAKRAGSAFPSKSNTRTSTPNPTVQNDHNTKTESHEERAVDVHVPTNVAEKMEVTAFGSRSSIELATGQSGEEEEEESEDAKIPRMLPSTPMTPSIASGGSQTQLVAETSSTTPTSSSHDVSKDSAGKKHSKAKDFMKKASKNMKKAKKKVGKGVEKMIPHSSKKKEDDPKTEKPDDTKDQSGSSANESTSSNPQFKRVSSERMKSKYARDKLAALEKKREEEAGHKASGGIPDPRQAAHERGEKLSELEDKTEQMRDHAASFAQNVALLKNRHASSS